MDLSRVSLSLARILLMGASLPFDEGCNVCFMSPKYF